MNGSLKILRDFKLRNTPSREAILSIFLKSNFALSHGDIENAIPSDFDRVTVYRTLKTFLDKGLIHKVLDDAGTLKYALCKEACQEGHQHDHVHFKCISCGKTLCLTTEIPPVKLPKGYQVDEVNLLIQGVCEKCS